MSTVVTNPGFIADPRLAQGDQRIVLTGLSWQQYITISDALPDHSGVRSAFDGENLELMTLSPQHERLRRILSRLVDSISVELGIDLQGGGSTTFRGAAIERGLEPDECYWIAHVQDVIGIDRWDVSVHPPPDLAVEIDVESQSVDRQQIYSQLRVPEIWRYDGKRLVALELLDNGTYQERARSLSFPFLNVGQLQPFLEASDSESEAAVVRSFMDWLRKQEFTA